MLRAGQGMLTLPKDLIQHLFCKDVRGFQAFVPFIYGYLLVCFNLSCLFGLCTFDLSHGYSTLDL